MSGPRDPFDEDAATKPVSDVRPASSDRTLLVLGPDGPASHPLPAQGTVRIGRGAQNDVRLADTSISRMQAVLELEDPFRVQSLSDVNPVKLRGQRLRVGQWAAFEPGEVLEMGALRLVVHAGRPPHVAPLRTVAQAPAGAVVVESPAMRELIDLVHRVADSDLSVLLLGETGVGKEVVAREVHASSSRRSRPFVGLSCAALGESLLESELFGYEQGAFTGATRAKPGLLESADGGTVFLDEIGEAPLGVQARLLRAIELRETLRLGGLRPRSFDVRFVAATHRNLASEVARGAFRQDLYFRLDGISLTIPPLRDRVVEIEPLATMFAARASARSGRPVTLGRDVLAALRAYAWPGNVRELRNVIERAVLVTRETTLTLGDLPVELRAVRAEPVSVVTPDTGLREDLAAVERERIIRALERCNGNQTRAAELLGISRRTLTDKLNAHALPRPRKR